MYPIVVRRVSLLAVGLAATLAAAAASQPAPAADNELDRLMARVLERHETGVVALEQYVLDEVERVSVTGPDGAELWGYVHEYTWYERDGFLIRSPVRFDGVAIDETRRRAYEADWLAQETRRGRRRQRAERPITRRSRRSTRDNVRLAIERLWGGEVEPALLADIVEDARAWGDDHAAIVAAGGRILAARGGVPGAGFARTLQRAHDGLVMLETGRLVRPEVAAVLEGMLPPLADAAAAARPADDDLDRLVELVDRAARLELPLAGVDRSLTRLRTTLNAGDRARAIGDAQAALSRAGATASSDTPDPTGLPPLQPGFVSESFFLEFPFEPGNYYLAGRETVAGRDVVRIEYYPERLFSDPDDRDPDDDRSARIDAAFEKTSLVTLWVDPAAEQIVRFTFDTISLDFLPGRWLVRVDDLTATMTMGQPIDEVWLPTSVELAGRLTLATGTYAMRYTRAYANFREAESGGRIRSVGPVLPR